MITSTSSGLPAGGLSMAAPFGEPSQTGKGHEHRRSSHGATNPVAGCNNFSNSSGSWTDIWTFGSDSTSVMPVDGQPTQPAHPLVKKGGKRVPNLEVGTATENSNLPPMSYSDHQQNAGAISRGVPFLSDASEDWTDAEVSTDRLRARELATQGMPRMNEESGHVRFDQQSQISAEIRKLRFSSAESSGNLSSHEMGALLDNHLDDIINIAPNSIYHQAAPSINHQAFPVQEGVLGGLEPDMEKICPSFEGNTNEALWSLEFTLMSGFQLSINQQGILRGLMEDAPNANEERQHDWARALDIEPKPVLNFVAATRLFQIIYDTAKEIRMLSSASENAEAPPFGTLPPGLLTNSNKTQKSQFVFGDAVANAGTKGREGEELVEHSVEESSMMQSQPDTKRSRQLSSSEERLPKRGKRNTRSRSPDPKSKETLVPGIKCTHPRCSWEGKLLSKWRRHEKEVCFPPNNYRCPECGIDFKKLPNARNHVRREHKALDVDRLLGKIRGATDILGYHTACRFVIEGKPCSMQKPQSWKDSMDHAEGHWLHIATRRLQPFKDWELVVDQCLGGHPDPKDIWGRSSKPRSHRRGDDDDNSPNGNSHHQNSSSSQGRDPSAGGGRAYNGKSSNSQGGNGTSRNYGGDGAQYQAASHKAIRTIFHRKLIENFCETLEITSLQSMRLLGQGGFGIVDEVKLLASSQVYARKIIYHSKQGSNYPPSLIHLHNEIKALSRLKHPHIVRLMGYYDTPAHSAILMSPVADCNLAELMTAGLRDRYLVLRWMRSLASALAHMHSKEIQVRHRDIKPENILVKGENVFLSDFGSSAANRLPNGPEQLLPLHAHNERHRPHLLSNCNRVYRFAVTSKYCAPEVVSTGVSGRASDIFSLGCVFSEMLTVACGESLGNFEEYRSKGQERLPFRDCLDGTREWIINLKTVKSDEGASQGLDDVFDTVLMMLQKAPNERLSAQSAEERLSKPCSDVTPEKGLARGGKFSTLNPQNLFPKSLPSCLKGPEDINPLPEDSTKTSSSTKDEEIVAVHAESMTVFANPTSPTVDLVVVHGLHGASERLSWVSSALPDARVISYSYQDIQSWQAIQVPEFLQTHANKLVACLKKFRKGLVSRPFMFLGHSLGASITTEVVIKLQAEPKGLNYLAAMPGIMFLSGGCTHKFDTLNLKDISDLVSKLKNHLGAAIKDVKHFPVTKEPKTPPAVAVTPDLDTGSNDTPQAPQTHSCSTDEEVLLGTRNVPAATKSSSPGLDRPHKYQEQLQIWTPILEAFVNQRLESAKPKPRLPRSMRDHRKRGSGRYYWGGGPGGPGGFGIPSIEVWSCT